MDAIDNKAAAIELRRTEGLSAAEIAARLNIAHSTARKHIAGVPAGVSGRTMTEQPAAQPAAAAPAKKASSRKRKELSSEDAMLAHAKTEETPAAPAEPAARPAKPILLSTHDVHAGPKAHIDAKTGLIVPMTTASYPELIDGELLCLGACGELKPATRFPYTTNKGDGKGRYVECGTCQTARLTENKARKAAGMDPLPRPRATATA